MQKTNIKAIRIFVIVLLAFYCTYLLDVTSSYFTSDRFNDSQKERLVLDFYKSIKEKKMFSQNKEDGVIFSLLRLLNLPLKGLYFKMF